MATIERNADFLKTCTIESFNSQILNFGGNINKFFYQYSSVKKLEQAGAELCQAQGQFGLAWLLSYKFSSFDLFTYKKVEYYLFFWVADQKQNLLTRFVRN